MSRRGFRPRLRPRTRRALFWTFAGLFSLVSATFGFAYAYVTDSDTLIALIQREAPRYLLDGSVRIDRARLRPLAGDVTLTNVSIRQRIDGLPFAAARAPWIRVEYDVAAFWNGRFVPREILVAQPVLRIKRRKDGTLNLRGLLADPLPEPADPTTPGVTIQNGVLQVEDERSKVETVLRDLTLRVEPATAGPLRFEGSARGEDLFARVELAGFVDPKSGRVSLTKGNLSRLTISQSLAARLPGELQPGYRALGLTAGEIDVTDARCRWNYKTGDVSELRAKPRLRYGIWKCDRLPFPLNDVSVDLRLEDGRAIVDRAEGINGKTKIRVEGVGSLDRPAEGPFDLLIKVEDLALDERLRAWSPREFAAYWRDFRPSGQANLALRAVRGRAKGPVGLGVGVDCRDVAMTYRHFKYPLEHIRGSIRCENDAVTLDLSALIGNEPARASGTIDDLGDDAVVQLTFEFRRMPIDRTLLEAFQPAVRKVVDDFEPTGSARGFVHLLRRPGGPDDPPEGKIDINANLELNEEDRCAMTWKGLPYPVEDLRGRLELHPGYWLFEKIRGRNGLSTVSGSGRVDELEGPDRLKRYKVDLNLRGRSVVFDEQLRRALPVEWRESWKVLSPEGACAAKASILVEPGKPDHYHVEIVPEPKTRVNLVLSPAKGTGFAAGKPLVFPPFEDVKGRFVFDDGKVAMSDVSFGFRGASVGFRTGSMRLDNGGRFDLRVKNLHATDFRIDSGLRQLMPPLMAGFARKIDEARTFALRADLSLGWSGLAGRPATCSWANGLVVFNDNTLRAGLDLTHLQGQLDHVQGKFDGKELEVRGALELESVDILGQQLTRLRSPLKVEKGVAKLNDLRGRLLGGELFGDIAVSLDATPKFSSSFRVQDADLERFTRTVPGRQKIRGKVGARLELSGMGYDLHSLQGVGEAHITRGDLGELPDVLRLVKLLNLSPATKTAFDSADVRLLVVDGRTYLNPIQLTGDAFSLRGAGTLDLQGDLDLRLRVLFGRDAFHIRGISDAFREVSGKIFDIHVTGPAGSPNFQLQALPPASSAIRRVFGRDREAAGARGSATVRARPSPPPFLRRNP